MSADVIKITQDLIRCKSVTPADEGAQDVLIHALQAAGFTVNKLPFGNILNFFVRIGDGGPHICYAGHTDVVPSGPADRWTFDPFDPQIKDGILYGRGASDMKGSVAAFAAAAINHVKEYGAPKNGSISLLITGDEEDLADDGTIKVLEWMDKNGQIPDVCLVGEPSNPETLGEQMKIGRRGSFSGKLRVIGKQGHVAYPMRSKNPVPIMIKLLHTLSTHIFDEGTDFFPPSNLEVTTIDTGNMADNVIPREINASFNIRFNDIWTAKSLDQKVRALLNEHGEEYTLETDLNAASFMTKPGAWTETVAAAVNDVTGLQPRYETDGGTSDARFVTKYCPVVEFGGINDSIHQIDENARVEDLENLEKIYRRVIERYLGIQNTS